MTGDDILITETTLRALGPDGDDFEERPFVPLKGKAATVRLYAPRRDGESPSAAPGDTSADLAGRQHAHLEGDLQ